MRLSLLSAFVLFELIFVLIAFTLAVLPRTSVIEHLRRDYTQNDEKCYTKEDAEQDNESKDCQSFLYKTLEDPTALFTGGLFTFTVTLAVATIGLFKVTKDGIAEQAALIRKSLKHAEASATAAELAVTNARFSAEQELRAYLFPGDFTFELREGGSADVRLVLKNAGKTPAYTVEVTYYFRIAEAHYTNKPVSSKDCPTKICKISVAVPGDDPCIETVMEGIPSIALESKLLGIFACGRITYVDAFGRPHWATFQKFHDLSATGTFKTCWVGNESGFPPV